MATPYNPGLTRLTASEDRRGWIGSIRQVREALAAHHCDRYPASHPHHDCFVTRGGIHPFLGLTHDDNDIVIAADAEYCVEGEWRKLRDILPGDQGPTVLVY